VNRLAAIALAAAAPLLAAMTCAHPPVVENATGGEVYVEVVYADGETFGGVLENALWLGQRGRVERLEIRRADGSIQRFDRARLELLAKDLPDRENVVWRIDAEGVQAVALDDWKRSQGGAR
jgi:hypothetical protein